MRKMNRGRKLLATLLIMAMLLCSFPAVFAEDVTTEIPTEEAVVESQQIPAEAVLPEPELVSEPELIITEEQPAVEPEIAVVPEEVPATEPEPEAVPEEAPVAEPEPETIPEEVPVAEPEPEVIPEEEPEPEPEPEVIPEEEPEPAPEPEEIPEEEPEPEPEPEEIPEEEPETEAIPEEEPASEPEPEMIQEQPAEESYEEWGSEPEAETETVGEEGFEDGDLVEIDDNDAGSVSGELLDDFNNPETYEKAEFSGNVEIVMKNSEIHFGGDVTLAAKVSGVEMNHRIVWEANDGDGRGWYTVGSGTEYTFTLTRENADREYRVSLFTAD